MIVEIKRNPKLKKRELDGLYQGLVDQIQGQVSTVKKKIEKQKGERKEITNLVLTPCSDYLLKLF